METYSKTCYEGEDAHRAENKKCPNGLRNEILLYKWGMEIISYFINFLMVKVKKGTLLVMLINNMQFLA